jgi:hypothetical protein
VDPTQTGVGLLMTARTDCENNPPNSKARIPAVDMSFDQRCVFLLCITKANNSDNQIVGVIHKARGL